MERLTPLSFILNMLYALRELGWENIPYMSRTRDGRDVALHLSLKQALSLFLAERQSSPLNVRFGLSLSTWGESETINAEVSYIVGVMRVMNFDSSGGLSWVNPGWFTQEAFRKSPEWPTYLKVAQIIADCWDRPLTERRFADAVI